MMLTSANRRGDAARCRELGLAAYLVKPVQQSELFERDCRRLGHFVRIRAGRRPQPPALRPSTDRL